MTVQAIRGAMLSFHADPFLYPLAGCFEYRADGLLLIEDGRIAECGDYAAMAPGLPAGVAPVHYQNCLILPGFIDTHVHYPQLPIVGATGAGLLDWLERYTYPAEAAMADIGYAEVLARRFLDELLRNGTTTAAVFCSVHAHSVDAFFAEAERLGALMIAGKVLMDRNAPEALRDTAQSGYDDSDALIRRWHGRGRLHYAVTPRFAPTSTPGQLDAAGALLRAHEGLYMQTHLCETAAEVAWVGALFPDADSYLDVYDRAGLVGPRAVFGHAIHMGADAFCRCHAADAALAHCPSSNLFLGSGLFRLFDAVDPARPVRVGLGSDVGAGTALSLLRNLGDAYKVAALQGRPLHPLQAFYLATLGGARALHLEHRIGRLARGHDADLCVLDLAATPEFARRTACCDGLEELLAVLMTSGDDRTVRATYLAGHCVWDAGASSLRCQKETA